jgi:hypothetical protein
MRTEFTPSPLKSTLYLKCLALRRDVQWKFSCPIGKTVVIRRLDKNQLHHHLSLPILPLYQRFLEDRRNVQQNTDLSSRVHSQPWIYQKLLEKGKWSEMKQRPPLPGFTPAWPKISMYCIKSSGTSQVEQDVTSPSNHSPLRHSKYTKWSTSKRGIIFVRYWYSSRVRLSLSRSHSLCSYQIYTPHSIIISHNTILTPARSTPFHSTLKTNKRNNYKWGGSSSP